MSEKKFVLNTPGLFLILQTAPNSLQRIGQLKNCKLQLSPFGLPSQIELTKSLSSLKYFKANAPINVKPEGGGEGRLGIGRGFDMRGFDIF